MQIKNQRVEGREKQERCCGALSDIVDPAFFKALCDPNRASIAWRLAEEGRRQTVGEVASCCPVDVSVVSRHLATLREAGIVVSEKKGRQVLYRVSTAKVVATLRRLADALERCCPTGMERIPEESAGKGEGER